MDPELLSLIVCPENHTKLAPAEPELIDRVNRAIAAGRVRNRAGQKVANSLEAGLVREDRTLLYPIVDDIPALLIDEAIALDQLEG